MSLLGRVACISGSRYCPRYCQKTYLRKAVYKSFQSFFSRTFMTVDSAPVLGEDGKPLSKGALKKLEKQREKDLRKLETAARLVHL
jgi:hypothetical protein